MAARARRGEASCSFLFMVDTGNSKDECRLAYSSLSESDGSDNPLDDSVPDGKDGVSAELSSRV